MTIVGLIQILMYQESLQRFKVSQTQYGLIQLKQLRKLLTRTQESKNGNRKRITRENSFA